MNRFVAETARALRARGHRVGVDRVLSAHRALALVDAGDRDVAYRALRATLCCDRDAFADFDAAFLAAGADGAPAASAHQLAVVRTDRLAAAAPGAPEPARDGDDGGDAVAAAWSEHELLRRRDFATLDEAELAAVRRAVRALARRGPTRLGRRRRPARPPARGDRIDVRATLRELLREELGHGRPRATCRRPATQPVTLVLDVSGSMAPYARVLLDYAHALVRGRGRVEVLAFATRLTRITGALRRVHPDAALAAVAEQLLDRGGGTRIGAALAELNRRWGGVVGRGGTVVVVSDGCDRGDPGQVAAEMARLARVSRRLVWVNPLSAQDGFAPVQRGMAAALPHVDRLLAGNSLDGLEALARLLGEDV